MLGTSEMMLSTKEASGCTRFPSPLHVNPTMHDFSSLVSRSYGFHLLHHVLHVSLDVIKPYNPEIITTIANIKVRVACW